ncbi:unnamed protein product [Schistocephalus solidus]|uniref:Cystatin domain-containing protein n=1 Tax=Schistocephalus solidus TaxID=70667 RepID=A0A183TA31_SCHSO|nr:unnamed protein product [Schistocephalus solidus]
MRKLSLKVITALSTLWVLVICSKEQLNEPKILHHKGLEEGTPAEIIKTFAKELAKENGACYRDAIVSPISGTHKLMKGDLYQLQVMVEPGQPDVCRMESETYEIIYNMKNHPQMNFKRIVSAADL